MINNVLSNNVVMCALRVEWSSFGAQPLISDPVQFVTNESSLSSSRDGAQGDQRLGLGSGHHSTVRKCKTGDWFNGWLVSWLVTKLVGFCN